MTPPPAAAAAPDRAPLGSARETRTHITGQRPRPLLVSLYAFFLADGGLVGGPARRRLGRFAARSVPAAVAAGGGGLVALRVFADAPPGPRLAGALAALAGGVAGAGWRCAAAARAGRKTGLREPLELGALLLVTAAAVAQLSERSGFPAGAPLQPALYLTLAALVALTPRGVGLALLLLTLALDLAAWGAGGADPEALPALGLRALFSLLFAALYHGVLGARIAAGRRAEAAALERRRRELDDRARQLRLLDTGAGAERPDGDEGREARAGRLTQAAVLEADTAARGLLAVAEAALRAHTVAVWLLGDDEAELHLWECRSASERVARRLPAGEGALGGVVKRRAAVRLAGDVKAANHYDDGARPRALLAVPLHDRVSGHLRGALLADRMQGEPFDERDERLLETLADEVARAVAAERLIRDGRARREEGERFYAALERLNRTAKPREVFDAVLDAAADMVPLDFGAVTLLEERDGEPAHRVARAVLGAPAAGAAVPAELEGREFPDNGGLVACAVRLGSSLPAKELKLAEAVVFDEATRLRGLGSLKVLPLRAGERVLGALVLGARAPGAYREAAVRQLEIVAMQAADSIERARLFEETERLATTDGLTGLVNHRTFQARLDEHLARAARYGKKLSLLLTDIDHFKSVNDTYGHPAGDEVLKGVARLLAREARTTDVAARYGGEEFALVMPETDEAGALKTAERLRERVAGAVFRTGQGELEVTLSIGIATFPSDGQRKPELIEVADGGLYHAKRHGRNQSVSLGALRSRRAAAGR